MTKEKKAESHGMTLTKTLLWLAVIGPWWPLGVVLILRSQDFFHNGVIGWFCTTHPIYLAYLFALSSASILYIISVIVRNCSIFDAFWSVLPASLYILLFAFHPRSHPDEIRRVVVIGAVWLWSVRLTGNWLIKGGWHEEDFRYIAYRKKMSPLGFQIFAFVALFVTQSVMVVTMTLPGWLALHKAGRPFGALDLVAALIVVIGVTFEFLADTQSLRFRKARDQRMKSHPDEFKGDVKPGKRFIMSGIWRYSRHPNYFGEICVWWGIYLFSIAATAYPINWTIIGPIMINCLFLFGSTQMTEAHELERKPEYAEYQKTTSRLFPWFPGRRAR